MKSPRLSKIIDGYTIAAEARRLSPHTLDDYRRTFDKFTAYLETDLHFNSIDQQTVERFLAQLPTTLSAKTVLNIHTGLSALWTWCVDQGLADENIVRRIKIEKPEDRLIVPFTETEIKAMLTALERSRPYTRTGKRETINTLNQASVARNRAIIFLLLDTGLRATELCNLKVRDADMRNRRIITIGKGNKERLIPFSAGTAATIWKYLAQRTNDLLDSPLFVTGEGEALNRDDLLKMLRRLGERAGVPNTHPHRFRHTFAIQFLRNGGNVYVLQMLLGHSTLTMCQRYLALAQTDADETHKHASPVMNWKL